MFKLYLLVFGIYVNGLMTRQSLAYMRYRAEPGNEENGENDEAEPLDMRYRAEPGNERIGIQSPPY